MTGSLTDADVYQHPKVVHIPARHRPLLVAAGLWIEAESSGRKGRRFGSGLPVADGEVG